MRTYRIDCTNRDGIRVRVSIRATSQEAAMNFAADNDLTDCTIYDWTARDLDGYAPRGDRAFFGSAAENI